LRTLVAKRPKKGDFTNVVDFKQKGCFNGGIMVENELIWFKYIIRTIHGERPQQAETEAGVKQASMRSLSGAAWCVERKWTSPGARSTLCAVLSGKFSDVGCADRSGKTATAIKQGVYAKVMMMTLCAPSVFDREGPANTEIVRPGRHYKRKRRPPRLYHMNCKVA
jgi:hypothetical protein